MKFTVDESERSRFDRGFRSKFMNCKTFNGTKKKNSSYSLRFSSQKTNISFDDKNLLLSLNFMTLFALEKFCVFIIMSINESCSSTPSKTILPLKNQCRLCSLLDCAKSKHSTLVGFLFNFFWNNSV